MHVDTELLVFLHSLQVNHPVRMVGGDGSGAHLALQAAWRLARQQPGSVDAAALHDWLCEAGARCDFYGAPGMVHDFAGIAA